MNEFVSKALGSSPQVCRDITQNVVQGDLVPEDLILCLGRGYCTEILVRPGVASDLVTFGGHSLPSLVICLVMLCKSAPYLDNSLPGKVRVIDCAFADIVTGDEESRFCAIAL